MLSMLILPFRFNPLFYTGIDPFTEGVVGGSVYINKKRKKVRRFSNSSSSMSSYGKLPPPTLLQLTLRVVHNREPAAEIETFTQRINQMAFSKHFVPMPYEDNEYGESEGNQDPNQTEQDKHRCLPANIFIHGSMDSNIVVDVEDLCNRSISGKAVFMDYSLHSCAQKT
ncbi:ribosomal protein L1p/L10e family [Striga asiatica]|uniref:Ribosomal protein L1p/L10e family n=1 Tax=Striga asiatica TaxID=4170 RepID=A0A5A7PZH3_STRAF|nr:ribosomal protein L1p/L10e family [Striga asiatica]